MTTPAGWYPDSGQPGQLRFWDGQAWTEHLLPMPPPPGAVAAPRTDLPKWMQRNEAERPDWMTDGIKVQPIEANGRDDIALVGESFYQDALWYVAVKSNFERGERVRTPIMAVLYPEPNNPHDSNAISAWIGLLKVGYFSREDAAAFRPSLDALVAEHGLPIALSGVLAGGGQRDDGPGNLGVWLSYDPEELKRS